MRYTTITNIWVEGRKLIISKCDCCNCIFIVYDFNQKNFCPKCWLKIIKFLETDDN